MVYEITIANKSTNKTYNISNKLNCRNFGIYAAIFTHCPATYVGQTITSFKDRWNAHRNSWKKNIGQTNIDDRNDQAALLKHYLTHHSDVLNECKNIISAWKVAFVEEPDPAILTDERRIGGTFWRIKHSQSTSRRWCGRVWDDGRLFFKNKLYLLNLILITNSIYRYTEDVKLRN